MADIGHRHQESPAPGAVRAFALVLLVALSACHPAKSVDFYRENGEARDKLVNLCLAKSSNSWDCTNAITAEAERWGTKDIDGFTVVISDAVTPPPAPTPH